MRRGLAGVALLLASTSCVAPNTEPPPPRPAPPATAPAPPPPVAAPPVGAGPRLSISARGEQGGVLAGSVDGAVALTLDGVVVPIAADGRFLIAFDRDAGPSAQLIATARDGRAVRQALAVAPRNWNIQSLPTLPKGTTPTPAFLARRKIELARINAARRIAADSDGWRQTFLWPTTGRISGVFGSQRIYAGEPGAPHSGVDVARPTGTPVVAPADGVVILAADAPFTLEGNLLMIDHGMGLNSAFLHLSRIDVKEGDRITRGQLVGAIGATGRATGPHLHWGMKLREVRIDPQRLAGAMPG